MPYSKRKLLKHTKIYCRALGYDVDDPSFFIPCELTGNRANDCHHIISRGKGGEDRIENLMALTRQKHFEMGDKNIYMPTLLLHHRTFLKAMAVEFDNDWFEDKLRFYTYKNAM